MALENTTEEKQKEDTKSVSDEEQNKLSDNIDKRIQDSLEKIRPFLNMEGGDVEYVSFDEKSGMVSVRLQGACSHCAISTVTLKMGIEKTLMEDIPEVKGVIQV